MLWCVSYLPAESITDGLLERFYRRAQSSRNISAGEGSHPQEGIANKGCEDESIR